MDETYDQIIAFAEFGGFSGPFLQTALQRHEGPAGISHRVACQFRYPLDEVLSVGDGAFQKKSAAKMQEIIGGGATTILVSHSLAPIRTLCNKVLWLERGKQIALGDAADICDLYQQFLAKTITLEQIRKLWVEGCI